MGNAFLIGNSSGGMSEDDIKQYLNSTVGGADEQPLDKLIPYLVSVYSDNVEEYETPGMYSTKPPSWANRMEITACGAGSGGGVPTSSGYGGGGGGGGAAVYRLIINIPSEYKNDKLIITVPQGGTGLSTSGIGPAAEDTVLYWENGGQDANSILYLRGGAGVNGSTAGIGGVATGEYASYATDGGSGGKGKDSSGSAEKGNDGLVGLGGAKYSAKGGGGGGSLGAGGSGGSENIGNSGTRGGGGAGGLYGGKGGDGGDGYVKIVWLP